jgi:hypothetical protein
VQAHELRKKSTTTKITMVAEKGNAIHTVVLTEEKKGIN